jgi:hypothetical protein
VGPGGEKADDPHLATTRGDPTGVDGSCPRHDAGDAGAGGPRHEPGREDQRGCVMCGGYASDAAASGQMERHRPPATRSATDLARLIERGLGYNEGHIDPVALR